jgi:hypothetical protein
MSLAICQALVSQVEDIAGQQTAWVRQVRVGIGPLSGIGRTWPAVAMLLDLPPGRDCARVVLGRIYPDQCALYGRACTPRTPIGPCMVSDEGACRIWWASGVRVPREAVHADA